MGSEVQAVAIILSFLVLLHWPQPHMCAGLNRNQLGPASALAVSLCVWPIFSCSRVPEALYLKLSVKWAGLSLEQCRNALYRQCLANSFWGISPGTQHLPWHVFPSINQNRLQILRGSLLKNILVIGQGSCWVGNNNHNSKFGSGSY